jgi:hypothetical protein
MSSNTINPNQIRPSATDYQVLGTKSGSVGNLNIVAGTGVTITQSGNDIIISASATPPALTIASFTGGGAVELGFAVVNPSFSATYTGTPTSANITNTDSIDSPHTVTTPFTSATLSGTFTHTSIATTTFTLHASDGTSNPTATRTLTWNPLLFGGVGTAGATTSVTASGSTAVLSTSDVIPNMGYGPETVGQVFGPFVTSSQNIYLLLTGGSHTFVDTGTGFPFAFNAPIAVSFVNANGVTVSMFLYQSTNPLFGTYNIRVAS